MLENAFICTCIWLYGWANSYGLVHYTYIAISNWFELTTCFLTFLLRSLLPFSNSNFFIHLVCLLFIEYCKRGKIRWAKLSQYLWFLRVPREFSVNKHWWTRHRKSTSAQNFMGLKPRSLAQRIILRLRY